MAPRVVRVVSLLPSATDTLNALEKTARDGKLLPFELCGCSHECEVPGGDSLERVSGAVPPVRLTRSRIGDIPFDDIELAFNSSVAAIQEFMTLCEPLAVPLIQYGLSAYELDLDELRRLKPDVILTCLQTAHSCILEGELASYAFDSVLGYQPIVVHTDGQALEEVYEDMLKISSAVGMEGHGHALVASMRDEMRRISARVQCALSGIEPLSMSVVWWANPVVEANAWVADMLKMLGVKNVGSAWKRANTVVWCLCGLGIDITEREAKKLVARVGLGDGVSGQRMAAMDGIRYLGRPGPLLVQSMHNLADIILGSHGCRIGSWKWLEFE